MADSLPKMTNQEVIDWVLACKSESQDSQLERERLADRAWRAYFNEMDFSKKEPWQSKVALPIWAMAVDQAKGAMGNALKKAQRLFSIEVPNPNDQLAVSVAHFTQDALSELLRRSQINKVITDGLHAGLITNMMVFKAKLIEEEIERFEPIFKDVPVSPPQFNPDGTPTTAHILDHQAVVESTLRFDIPVINPVNFWVDPANRGLYKIQRALWDTARLETQDAKNLFRAPALAAALTTDAANSMEDDIERRNMQLLGTRNAMRRQVELLEYWGPIYDKQGRLRYKNRWVIIFNRKELGLMDPYPFWHGGDPYSVSNLIRVPFSPYGKMLYQHAGPLNIAITELMCMILDSEKYGTLKGFGIDTGLLEDVDEIADGLFPGITLSTLGPNAIQQLDFKGAGQLSLQVLGELIQGHQNATGINEFLTGQASTRGRATATEVQTKGQQSAGFFDSLSGEVEEYGLEPLIEKCWWNMLQFFDQWDAPYMQALAAKWAIPIEVLGRNAVERYKIMHQPFKFHVVGLSAMLRRAEMQEKLLRLLEILGNRPDLNQMTNVPKLFERIMEAFEFEDLVAQGNEIPGVIAPTAISPQGSTPIPGTPGFMGIPGTPYGQRPGAKKPGGKPNAAVKPR